MKILIERILASAAAAMWQEEQTLGDYTAATAEHELNLAFHFATRLRQWMPWLDCDFDLQKPDARHMRPDIIFHRRGGHAANYLVVEIKRGDNFAGGRADLQKIEHRWFGTPYLYRFGASVVFNEKERTTKLCVTTRGTRAGFNEYFDSANFDPVTLPRESDELRRCVECASAIIAAERESDAARVAELEAEIDTHVLRLYGAATRHAG